MTNYRVYYATGDGVGYAEFEEIARAENLFDQLIARGCEDVSVIDRAGAVVMGTDSGPQIPVGTSGDNRWLITWSEGWDARVMITDLRGGTTASAPYDGLDSPTVVRENRESVIASLMARLGRGTDRVVSMG